MGDSESFCIGLKVKMESGECGIIKKLFQEFVYMEHKGKRLIVLTMPGLWSMPNYEHKERTINTVFQI